MARIGVEILGDSKSLERAFKRSEVAAAEFNGRMNRLSQSTRGAFAGAGFNKGALLFGSASFVGAAVAADVLRTAVTSASDLNEQLAKSQQVFGDASQSVADFGDSSAKNLGISKREAIAAAATFGNLFRTIDLAPAQNAAFSKSLVQLASDLASFNNVNPADALLALRSGLIGEAEPLRRFGVLLSEARVQQQALADTGKRSTKEITNQEKVLARYKIILQDTKTAQGDFQRTSGGLANQSRQLRANLDDLAGNLGTLLIPALADLARLANESALALKKLADVRVPGGGSVGEVFGWVSGWKELHFLLDQIQKDHADVGNSLRSKLSPALRQTTADVHGYEVSLADAATRSQELAGVSDFLASDMADAASRIAAATAQINQALSQEKASGKRFTTFLKGLDLKLSKAQLTDSIDKQIAVLREREQAILRREAKVGKKFELEVELTAVRQDIKDLQDQKTRNALADQQAREAKILALKQKQSEELRKQLEEQKRIAAEAQRALDAATTRARSLFGTLFENISDEASRTLTILGGSKGKQTVVLPGAGGGEDARGLLSDLNVQIKSFKALQANILELQRKGAPQSLLEAARSGQISADQVAALADANSATLNKIFKNVRLADKLITRAAKAEINAKDVNLRANTVTIRGAVAATSSEHGRGDSGDIVIHVNTHVDGKKIDASIERHRKKRTQPTRGRSGGKR